MSEQKRKEVIVEGERRSKKISQMIDEGGLGAETYYNIKKDPKTEHKVQNGQQKNKDE